jgi:hypothetical protein
VETLEQTWLEVSLNPIYLFSAAHVSLKNNMLIISNTPNIYPITGLVHSVGSFSFNATLEYTLSLCCSNVPSVNDVL